MTAVKNLKKINLNFSGWSKFMSKKIIFCLITTLLLTSIATAEPLRVPQDYTTIEAAITAAIAGTEKRIVVDNGNYTPLSPDGFDFGGELIQLKSRYGPQNCIINCNSNGRAFYFHHNETQGAKVDGFTIKNGNQYYGGAIECEVTCSPTINNCILTNNAAVYGGAIDCFYSSPVITNCIIINNISALDGGAIECYSESSPVIKNCLIANNTTEGYGGTIDCYDMSSPQIKICTIANNTGNGNNGGIYTTGASSPSVINSILWDSGSSTGAVITYSCLQDGNNTGIGNIHTNPIFRKGPYPFYGNYYLSQTDANQIQNSPCIDAGHGKAADFNDVNMPDIDYSITRTDNVQDAGIVNMGFHYPASTDANYVLITEVDPNGNYGKIDPNYPAPGQIFKQFAEVRLHTTPDVNCQVMKWAGTNDDNSTDVNNIVTMDANRTVIVTFRSIIIYKLTTSALDANGSIDPYSALPFIQHSVVDINAYPNPGYVVKKWFKGNTATFNISDPAIAYDPCLSNPSILPVAMESDTTVAVQFMTNPITHSLVASVTNGFNGHGTISPQRGNYPEGTIVTLTALPQTGYRVKKWTGTNDNNSVALTNTVTMNVNKNVTVGFEAIPRYYLTISVNNPTLGSVEPNSGWFEENTVVNLTATPVEGYRVRSWSGTNDQPAFNVNTNTVTIIDANKTVSVVFELDYSKVINVFSDDVNGIQKAIDRAQNGDTIQLHPGTYVIGPGISLNDKAITIVGDPEHPENVIIDCLNESSGITLSATGSQTCTLNGISIANLHTVGLRFAMPINPLPGMDGYDSISNIGGALTLAGNHTVKNCIIRDCSLTDDNANNGIDGHRGWFPPNIDANTPNGGNGGNGGNAGGAGIYITAGNPIITNVLIENCLARGGSGGNGAAGWADPTHHYMNPPPPADNNYFDPGHGGRGGAGGYAIGAGIYVLRGSPKFTNVTVNNCTAISGNGGNGGNGPIDGDAGDGNVPGRTLGAGIYCNPSSLPVFVNCTINDCKGYSGKGGNGGDAGLAQYRGNRGGYGGLTTDPAAIGQGDLKLFTTKGGAIFCDSSSTSEFINCAFNNNIVYGSISGIGGLDTPSRYRRQPERNYRLPSFGAGVFCSTASSADFNSCLFSGNRTAYNQDYEDTNYLDIIHVRIDINGIAPYDGENTGMGGGLCLWYALNSNIHECNFTRNSAPIGGGIYAEGSVINISDSNLINNISTGGGGILSLEGILTMSDSAITGNIAGTLTGYYPDSAGSSFGTGGGIYALDTYMDINDTLVTKNDATITGGGICLDGDTPLVQLPRIKNSLITKNTAGDEGGGIAAIYFAQLKILNCTIADNIVSGANGNGGGLFASYGSEIIAKDTIFWNNNGIDGSQIALSNYNSDIPAKLTLTYSDIDLRYKSAFDLTKLASGSTATSTSVLVDSQTIYSQITSSGSAKVIVSLAEPAQGQTTNWTSSASVATLRSQIAASQNQVLSSLTSGEFTLRNKLTNVAAFSGQVTQAGLNKLLSNSLVAHIEPVRTVYPALAQGIPLMNALGTRPEFNGQGLSIAIVDTGIDYTHPRLGGGTFPNSKVIGGYDFGDNDADPKPSNSTTDGAHGTCCAGIAAGSLGTIGDYIGGVAYNAKLYALKASPNGSDGLPTDATLAAWDWCITHRNDNPANPIMVISNSWGMVGFPINNSQDGDAFSPAHTTLAQTAVYAGITILASSGNDGFAGEGVSWPAAMSNVISVGAVYDAAFISQSCNVQTQPDQVTCYSNTADILNILAPSENAYTTDIVGASGFSTGDYFPFFNGTSAACPYAAGAVAALQSAAKQLQGYYLTPPQVKTLLRMTGDSVTDTKVTITKPRINLGSAIALLSSSVPIYSETGCTITGLAQDVNNIWAVSDNNNISHDPNFIYGYYLSHTATKQDVNSVCIDAGSTTAAALGLDTYTTRIDGIFDDAIVDLGYHYHFAANLILTPQYDITVTILQDANYPGIHGTIITADPNKLISYDANTATYKYRFSAGTTPTLTAIPDANYFVKGWYDKNNTKVSANNTFSFIVDANNTYFVRFKPGKIISVSGGGATLKNAVNAAENGDTLIVAAGTYSGGINLGGKQIKLYGVNPDDPNVVSRTIINCAGTGPGFVFSGGETAETVINGFAITNATMNNQPGAAISIGTNSSPLIINVDISNCTVNNASGGAIYISSESYPEFRNVNITNCSATLNGGGVYISGNSSPVFNGCSIADCFAGINGGAVYCRTMNDPEFINCSFSNNSAGDSAGAIFYETLCNVILEGCKFTANTADMDAGAVMCSSNCIIDINNCDIADNNSDYYGGGIYIDLNCDGIIHSTKLTSNAAFEDGGAIYITDSNAIEITDCNIIANTALRGGGVFALESPKLTINNCQINSNEAYRLMTYFTDPNDANTAVTDDDFVGEGGGIYAFSSIEQVMDCQITGNMTKTSGGGIYISGDQVEVNRPLIKNCLITKNIAGRDGGGISSNWFAITAVQNCTIADNTVAPSGFSIAVGGGIYCSYASETSINNSIIWGNMGHEGSQIAVGGGDEAYPLPAIVNATYTDIQDPNPADVKAPDLDVVICVDTTGSMSAVLDSIKAAASDIVDRIAKDTNNYRIAVVDYKDSPAQGDPYTYRDDASFTNDKSKIQTAINGFTAGGGGDWPEAVYSGLMHSIDGNSLGYWRSDTKVKKIIILMGDAPPHDPEPNTGYTLTTVTTAAGHKNINIFSILTGSGVGEPTATRYFTALAKDTNGVLIETPDGSKAAEAVLRAIDLATLQPVPIYIEPNCILNYWTTVYGWNDVNSHNIHSDPNFILGYYLGRIATGQNIDSNCIDAGSTTAAALGLDTYTTRIDGIFDDANDPHKIVDLGYHYRFAATLPPQYDITVTILQDANYPGIHGTITADPNNLISHDANTATYKYRFSEGSSPVLTAVPDANYFIRGWYDTNSTKVSANNTFSFTVDANDTYFVRFGHGKTTSVSGGGTALRNAVELAENGDTLIVAAGTYNGGINIGGKQIKLYGVNPDDPNVVNRTIIDCSGGLRGFIFSGGETAETVINGFTITNATVNNLPGAAIYIGTNSSPLIINVDISNCSAGNDSGGAIYISSESSPEFRNVNITNCSATLNGGGVYISYDSNPIFRDCSIADCNAGVNGGAVYCTTPGRPEFYNFSFTNNYAADSAGAIFYNTSCAVTLSGCEFTNNIAQSSAGAVMCGMSCIVEVNNCNFSNNEANYAGAIYLDADCDGRIRDTKMTGNTVSEDGGAIYIIDSNTIYIADCNITANIALRGGGIFALESPNVMIYDCSINSNEAYRGDFVGEGGGIYAFRSIEQIADCKISGNRANTSGGGIYISGDQKNTNYPLVKNCLIANNQSNRDGGGISVNWFATPKIQICTITGNQAANTNGKGGGLYCSYASKTLVKDTIFWANNSVDGSQIAVGSGDEAYPLPADVNITYSDIDLREGANFDLLDSGADAGSGTTTGVLIDSQTINNQITSSGSANVIVSLVEPIEAYTTNWSSSASVSELRSQIAIQQNQALSTLDAGEFTLRHKLENVSVFSGQITQTGLNKLLNHPLVANIEPVRTFYPMTAQGIPLMNALNTRGTYNGQGVSIAIVDTGIDYTHPRLGGGAFPNSKVIGGYDTGNNDADPMPVGQAHGTCCAGIAAGLLGTVGDYIGGVAYNTKIYALKASPDNAGYFFDDAIIAAWDWCISHKNDDPQNPILVISNSLGGGKYSSSEQAEQDSPALADAAKRVVDAGITIMAASGNNGYTDSIAVPAAFSSVISVGAVYDAAFLSQTCNVQTQPDHVTCYSNTANILDVLAPSENAYTTTIGGGYEQYFNGTSAACPYAAGAVAALQSAAKQLRGAYLTPAEIREALKITGDTVTDTKVEIAKPRVNLGEAITLLSQSVPIYVEKGCTLTGLEQNSNNAWMIAIGSHNIAGDPNFVLGYWGNYYLSQIITNDPLQTVDSLCVDAGLGSAISNGMYKHTTRTDHVIDIAASNVDVGYHYTLSAEILGDLNFDGVVDLEDLSLLMLYWLQDDCTFPDYCYGTDLNEDGQVNFEDFALFAENYGQTEKIPPKPDPMTWVIKPHSSGMNEIAMTATTAMDSSSGSRVEYYFDCNSPGGHNSGWTISSTYVDMGLVSGTTYEYRVKARDARHNETGWSTSEHAIASPDITPPQPDRMTWASEPCGISSTSIQMVATTALDSSGVEYYFHCLTTGGHDSNNGHWQDATLYVDAGLDPCTTYTYQVKARDKSPARNETQYSLSASATTLPPGVEIDSNAPTPNPSEWLVYPYVFSDGIYYHHTMTAVTATDASPGSVWYYFECVSNSQLSSGWIRDNPTYTTTGLLGQNYTTSYRVRTKDSAPTPNVGDWSPIFTIPLPPSP